MPLSYIEYYIYNFLLSCSNLFTLHFMFIQLRQKYLCLIIANELRHYKNGLLLGLFLFPKLLGIKSKNFGENKSSLESLSHQIFIQIFKFYNCVKFIALSFLKTKSIQYSYKIYFSLYSPFKVE